MPTRIANYYEELQRREGLEPVQLVAEWAQGDFEAISAAFRNAFTATRRMFTFQMTKPSPLRATRVPNSGR